MARGHNFRIIPASGNGYPGLTALPAGDGKEIVAMGTGEAVEAALVERLADLVATPNKDEAR
jgi:hypothetical protein